MPVVIKVTTDRFRDLTGRLASSRDPSAVSHAREHAERAGAILAAAMRQEAPNGRPDPLGRPKPAGYRKLRDNITVRVLPRGNGFTVRIGGPRQVIFVLQGTRPHKIPRGGSAAMRAKGYPLHFYWFKRRREVWFCQVNHPGTPPNRFDLRAARRVGEQVKAEARRGAIQAFIRPVTAFWRGSGA
ncbi:MAG: hypothetical protein GXY76_08835 [Chloroflexi bacterium]|nr:hypothetical protein [Chloroflexota bacterium]